MMKSVKWEYTKGTWTFTFSGHKDPVVVTKYDVGYQIFKEVTGLEDKWNQMVDNLHLVALDLNCEGSTVEMCCHTCNNLTTGLLHEETNEVTCLVCRQTEPWEVK